MSLNTFMKQLDPNPIKSQASEEIINYTRMEKLDTFLDSRVINKYKQPWKNLTKFLKRDRIILFFNENIELKEHLSTVLEQLDNYLEKVGKAQTIFRNNIDIEIDESFFTENKDIFDNQVQVVKDYLKKYTKFTDQKIKNRIKNIFGYCI